MHSGATLRLSAVYWSPGYGPYTWENSQPSHLGSMLDAYVSLGLGHLDIALPWSSFQPDGRRVPSPPMRDLERVLDACADRSLSVTVSVPSLDVADDTWAPPWALQADGSSMRRVVRGHHVDRSSLPDVLRDVKLTDSIHALIREILGAFAGHPAIDGWRLADGILAVSPQTDPDVVLEWLRGVVDTARASGAAETLRFTCGLRDLLAGAWIDLRGLAELGLALDCALGWSPAWRRGAGSEWYAFICTYARSLHGQAIGVTGMGIEKDIAMDQVVRGVIEGGGAACSAWTVTDFSPTLQRAAPFDLHPELLNRGLLDLANQPTGAGREWADVARDAPVVQPLPDAFSSVDSELRMHDPEGYARECFEAWTA